MLAGLGAVVNFMWLPCHPLWGVPVIALDVAILWALTTHGTRSAVGLPALAAWSHGPATVVAAA